MNAGSRSRPLVRALGGLGLFVALVALGGCSRTPVVSGTVTYKKQPLKTGEVSFIATNGKSRSGLIGRDGRYEVRDPPSGKVTIIVIANQVEGASAQGQPTAVNRPKTGKVPAPASKSLIPTKFNDPKTSGLSYDVGSGKQTKDIDLGD